MDYRKMKKKELVKFLEEQEKQYKMKQQETLDTAQAIYNNFLKIPYGTKDREHFIVVTLNSSLKLIGTYCISVGVATRTLVDIKDVFAPAIIDKACSIVVAHNHPSGYLVSSEADKKLVKQVVKAGKILNINVLDSLIFDSTEFYSMFAGGEI